MDEAAASRIARTGADPQFSRRAAEAAARNSAAVRAETDAKEARGKPMMRAKRDEMAFMPAKGKSKGKANAIEPVHMETSPRPAYAPSFTPRFDSDADDEPHGYGRDAGVVRIKGTRSSPAASSTAHPVLSYRDTGWDTLGARFSSPQDHISEADSGGSIDTEGSRIESGHTTDVEDSNIELLIQLNFPEVRADIVQRALAGFRTVASGLSSSGSTPGTSNERAPKVAPASHKERKRSKYPQDEGEDEQDDRQLRKRHQGPKPVGDAIRSFACPFAKKDPLRYSQCYKNKITRVRYVRQHLARCHEQPIHCPCCKFTFDTDEDLQSHAEAKYCSPRRVEVDGVSRTRMAKIRKRVPKGMDEASRWFRMFDILFPDHQPRPRSPFIDPDLGAELCAFQNYMAIEGSRTMTEVFEQRGFVPPETAEEGQMSAAILRAVITEGLDSIVENYIARLRRESTDPADCTGTSVEPGPAVCAPTHADSGTSTTCSADGLMGRVVHKDQYIAPMRPYDEFAAASLGLPETEGQAQRTTAPSDAPNSVGLSRNNSPDHQVNPQAQFTQLAEGEKAMNFGAPDSSLYGIGGVAPGVNDLDASHPVDEDWLDLEQLLSSGMDSGFGGHLGT